jgi:hypothetical protein
VCIIAVNLQALQEGAHFCHGIPNYGVDNLSEAEHVNGGFDTRRALFLSSALAMYAFTIALET